MVDQVAGTGDRRALRRGAALLGASLTGSAGFLALLLHVPAPGLTLWGLAVLAREQSLSLIAAAGLGMVASAVARGMGARNLPRVATATGLSAIVLAGVPSLEALEDAREAGVDLSLAEYFAGPSFLGGADPSTERYARTPNGDLLVDVYLPEASAGPAPAVVFVHGGSWRRGWRSMTPRWNEWLTSGGYAVFDIDYRLGPAPTWEGAPGDVKCAVGWVRRHADRFGVDPGRIVLMGASAGAHLSLLAAYTADEEILPPSCPGPSGAVDAVVALYPPTDLPYAYGLTGRWSPLDGIGVLERFTGGTPDTVPSAYLQASPLRHVDSGVPPTLLAQGGRDQIKPAEDVAMLAERLAREGVAHRLLWLSYADHAFDASWGGWGSQITRHAVADFLEQHLGQAPAPRLRR